MPLEDRWNLPVDADVLFVIHGEGDTRDVAKAPRPAGWPGKTRLVQIASAGLDDYPDWLFEAPVVASSSGTNSDSDRRICAGGRCSPTPSGLPT